MASNKQEAQQEEDGRINVHDADAVKQCAKQLGIEEQYLIQAIYEAGPMLKEIRAWLEEKGDH